VAWLSPSCIYCGAGRGLDLRVLKRRNTVPEYVAALRIGREGQCDDPNCGNDGQADKEPNRWRRNLVERPGCISHAHQRLIGDKCSVLVPRLSSIISIASQEGQAKTSSSGLISSLGIVRMCFMVSPQETHQRRRTVVGRGAHCSIARVEGDECSFGICCPSMLAFARPCSAWILR
jgi:hypothetical protein